MKKLRRDYLYSSLSEELLEADPLRQFKKWFSYQKKARTVEPNAFCLATCGPGGRPSQRMLLLKEVTDQGFIFYTNYQSRKGSELKRNKRASMLFYWSDSERQVRIEGRVRKVSAALSERYFDSRPLGARISAAVSRQSQAVDSRQALEEAIAEFIKKQGKSKLKRPSFWGGYLLVPDLYEYWQGRKNRLHDRFVYRLKGGVWRIQRLAP